MKISKLEEFLAIGNTKEKEPALKFGTIGATVVGIFAIAMKVFPDALTDDQELLIGYIIGILIPLLTAVFTRGKVWNAESVDAIIEEAHAEAQAEARKEVEGQNKTAWPPIRSSKPESFPPDVKNL